MEAIGSKKMKNSQSRPDRHNSKKSLIFRDFFFAQNFTIRVRGQIRNGIKLKTCGATKLSVKI